MRFAEIFKTELFSKYGQKAGCYINEIYDIMAAFVSSIGAIIVLWMLFEMGMAVQSQEGTMQANGIKKVGGGLVMVLAPQLISALI